MILCPRPPSAVSFIFCHVEVWRQLSLREYFLCRFLYNGFPDEPSYASPRLRLQRLWNVGDNPSYSASYSPSRRTAQRPPAMPMVVASASKAIDINT